LLGNYETIVSYSTRLNQTDFRLSEVSNDWRRVVGSRGVPGVDSCNDVECTSPSAVAAEPLQMVARISCWQVRMSAAGSNGRPRM